MVPILLSPYSFLLLGMLLSLVSGSSPRSDPFAHQRRPDRELHACRGRVGSHRNISEKTKWCVVLPAVVMDVQTESHPYHPNHLNQYVRSYYVHV